MKMTLHMRLAGIRDISVLEEPPVDRTPIQTYVMEYNDILFREFANGLNAFLCIDRNTAIFMSPFHNEEFSYVSGYTSIY